MFNPGAKVNNSAVENLRQSSDLARALINWNHSAWRVI